MESPERNAGGRGRHGGSVGRQRSHRSASNRSSTSSDILVAPALSTVIPKQPVVLSAPISAPMEPVVRSSANVHNGHVLVVRLRGDQGHELLRRIKDDDLHKQQRNFQPNLLLGSSIADEDTEIGVNDRTPDIKIEANDDDEGPNHRGTYSRKYTEAHPEITWQHRGQGRYLPVPKRNATVPGLLKSSSTDTQTLTNRIADDFKPALRGQRRRSYDDNTNDTHLSPLSARRPSSLRRLSSDAQTNSAGEQRSARLGRRAKPAVTGENERRSSRISSQHNYNEDDEEDSDGMGNDKEPTFDKAYVDAHPNERFYHTGNGWYKRGQRPREHKRAKNRDFEGHALTRLPDGSYQFDNNRSIHVSQLDNYPGIEFHHCGNGWYKPGPDATGLRASRIGGGAEDEDNDEEDEDQDEGSEHEINSEDDDTAVSKEYTLQHKDIEWVHRGNGRYKRKSAVRSLASGSVGGAQSATPATPDVEGDGTIYSKKWVEDHPEEVFHHRGNARYMRGPPPERWAQGRRKKQMAAGVKQTEDGTELFSKAWVDAHPGEVFHHRGQGRYARGPRPSLTAPVEDEDEAESDNDPDGLVDTDYVDRHPDETFHHRGQGRWARGLPPPGASNKTAIRGPAAQDKTDAARLLDEEDETVKPPGLTALVLKVDGPDTWPGLQWHYRGGGKWGRITKQEYEDMQRRASRRPKGKGRMRSMDGPEAQLEREAAAAEANRHIDGSGFLVPGEIGFNGQASQERPKIKRRRTGQRGSLQTHEDGVRSKQTSNSHSQAPTPKPRMLAPEEDILTEDDLPQLYRDDWTPDSEDIELDPADRLIRATYRPLNQASKFVKGLTRHDPAVRPLDNLKKLAANAQTALDKLQAEYLRLDKTTAPHARIPRKPAKGGRMPIDYQIFEDRKEADLYDYNFDPRRIGYQDPQAQKIQRDEEGRELRYRRNRGGVAVNNGTLPGWNFGEDEPLGPRRAVKPVNRFDGIVDQPRKRARNSTNATGTGRTSKAPSMTPDIVGPGYTTPLGGPAPNGYAPARRGRWAGHVPKRIQQLRDESVGGASARGSAGGAGREMSPGTAARKGRPPGSKNLHKRRDAGIKKGPRKPKVVESIETPGGSEVDAEEEDGYEEMRV